jgi:hypothetical protein
VCVSCVCMGAFVYMLVDAIRYSSAAQDRHTTAEQLKYYVGSLFAL